MEARGLTLVEVVAVLAVLVVVTALALPAVQTRLDESRFDAAEQSVEAAIVTARAEAMRRGVPVSLVGRAISGGETGLFVEGVGTGGGVGVNERSAGDSPMSGAREDRRANTTSSLGTPVVVIGTGVRLSAKGPDAVDGRQGAEASAASATKGGASAATDDVVIARFMPDGTAVVGPGGAVYVMGRGLAAACHINRWTGSGTVEAIDLAAKAGADATPPREETPAAGVPKEPTR
jgi:type II secretory pathway pseudopilin PulG